MVSPSADQPTPKKTGIVIGAIVAALAVAGVLAFVITRDGDDDSISETTAAPPEITIPDDVTIPDDITIPDITRPGDLTIPDITLPDFTFPTLPDFTFPTFPDFTIPTFPDFTIPDLSIPGGPDISDPGVQPGPIPPGVDEPTGLGSDASFNALAQECFDGDMQMCDDLYDQTVSDDALEAYTIYGDTCAGRQPEGTNRYCTATFPGP